MANITIKCGNTTETWNGNSDVENAVIIDENGNTVYYLDHIELNGIGYENCIYYVKESLNSKELKGIDMIKLYSKNWRAKL